MLKLTSPLQAEIVQTESHTVLVLYFYFLLNLGLRLQALVWNWFSLARFHLQVTQINPIAHQKEAIPHPPPKARPDPDPSGLFTPSH